VAEPHRGETGTELTVVIPAFNEVGRLPSTLDRILEFLRDNTTWIPAEIVVVDDGSTDGTADARHGVSPPDGVRLITTIHEKNLGKGAAVRTGFSRSSGRWLLLSDADLATPIEEIDVLFSSAAADRVVLGSRAVDRRLIEVHQPRYRDLMGRVFNMAVRTLLLPDIADTQCGFKLFPGDLGRALAGVQTIDGFAYDVELLVLSRHWGYSLHETAVRWRHVEASRVSAVRHSSQMLMDLLVLAVRRIGRRLPAAPFDGRRLGA
jgi:dolichyl-phosphate beta-glucosyltransferase